MKQILIASSSHDVPSFIRVVDVLKKSGAHPIVYEADKVAHAEVAFNFEINPKGVARFTYKNYKIYPEALHAAWCRRPYAFEYPEEIDRLLANSLGREAGHVHDGLWATIPDDRWLNSPRRMRWAENKPWQLQMAAKAGFTIPRTIAANRWELLDVISESQIIIKPAHSGSLWHKNGLNFLYSTLIDKSKPPHIKRMNPFPSLCQPYVQKAREWRVTVVGNEIFPVAIYAKGKAQHDWRHPTYDPTDLTYKKESFDTATAKRCTRLLKDFGLRFGAFDFIESNDGTLTFLEVNPAGQYFWLEEMLNLPISKAIAEELLRTGTS